MRAARKVATASVIALALLSGLSGICQEVKYHPLKPLPAPKLLPTPDLRLQPIPQLDPCERDPDCGLKGPKGKPLAKNFSARVLAIQQALKSAGFNPGLLDGQGGPQTKAAIKDFQRSRGLTADGTVGPQTAAALKRAASANN